MSSKGNLGTANCIQTSRLEIRESKGERANSGSWKGIIEILRRSIQYVTRADITLEVLDRRRVLRDGKVSHSSG